jgi:hypothetical protein
MYSLYVAIGISCVFMLVSRPPSCAEHPLIVQIRSCYRVAEYTAGGDSSLAHSEVAFYLLDTLPMLLFCVIYLVVWAPNVFDSSTVPNDIYLTRAEALKSSPYRQTA